MRIVLFLISIMFATSSLASTLEEIKNRGYLTCGVSGGLAGFSQKMDGGSFEGFDVDYCRAVAAAIGVDDIYYVELTTVERLDALKDKDIDVLSRTTTWTLSRDTSGFSFIGTIFYDGEGFMVRDTMPVNSPQDFGGKTFCVREGTTTLGNLADYFTPLNVEYSTKVYADQSAVNDAYLNNDCQVYVLDASGLAAIRSTFDEPDMHKILSYRISKEPLSPVVRDDDPQWIDITRWTLFLLIALEEKGIDMSSGNTAQSLSPGQKTFMKSVRLSGANLGLDNRWGKRVAKIVGNYETMFDRNLGPYSELKLERGLNALWIHGGLLYSAPFK